MFQFLRKRRRAYCPVKPEGKNDVPVYLHGFESLLRQRMHYGSDPEYFIGLVIGFQSAQYGVDKGGQACESGDRREVHDHMAVCDAAYFSQGVFPVDDVHEHPERNDGIEVFIRKRECVCVSTDTPDWNTLQKRFFVQKLDHGLRSVHGENPGASFTQRQGNTTGSSSEIKYFPSLWRTNEIADNLFLVSSEQGTHRSTEFFRFKFHGNVRIFIHPVAVMLL